MHARARGERSSAGEKPARAACVGARCAGAPEDLPLDRARAARLDQLTARSRAAARARRWRGGAAGSRRSARTVGPSSGSRAKRRWNSLVSSSSASMKRARSNAAASLVARTTTRPSGDCRADASLAAPAAAPCHVRAAACAKAVRPARRDHGGRARRASTSPRRRIRIAAAAGGGTVSADDARRPRSRSAPRRRKLRLFLDELRPTAETTVLDVGADELGFGDAAAAARR